MIRIVALTGGIGSGKSAAAKFLQRKFDGEYIDADLVCRNLLEKNNSGWQAIVKAFDEKYLAKDQTLDRQALRKDIFRDAILRSQVNSLLHPLVGESITRMTDAFKSKAREKSSNMVNKERGDISDPSSIKLVLVEVPLLYEAAWEKRFDRTVVVYADRRQCMDRLMKRDWISAQEAKMALSTQFPLEEKALMADHVIDNSGTWSNTCLQLLHLGSILRRK